MRVLTRANLGGPTRQAIALWHAQRDLGVKTLLVTGAVDENETALSPAAEGIPEFTFEEAIAAGPGAEGWIVIPHLGRGVALFSDWRARSALQQLVAAKRPHVVHTHTSKAGWLGRAVARRARVPVVAHTFHGHVLADYFGKLPSAALARLEARLAIRTDLLFAVSRSCADELAAAKVAARERFVVVPPAVPTTEPLARDDARRLLGIPAGQPRIACVGRLVPIKRVEHFVATVALCPGVHGDVFGDGPERAALAQRASAMTEGRVVMRGALPDVALLLAAYDAVLLPSIREGFPLVAVEAFAAGVPMIGYDVPGVQDALGEGRGILVGAGDGPAGLAAAVDRLLAEPGIGAACVAAARSAVPRFAPSAVAEQLMREYQAALAQDSGVATRARS